jgi:tRNA (uracil-5-)-methyltransferase TRM9
MTDIQSTYNNIAKEFSDSRYRVWKSVAHFLDEIQLNTINADIGCGNGKNMKYRKDIQIIGMDLCANFVDICKQSKLNVIQGNVLNIPFESNYFDNVISIAVIHHLKTKDERVQAIKELIRITKPGGRILIYVWAFEQDVTSKRKFETQDVLVPFRLKNSDKSFDRFYHVYVYGELENEVSNNNENVYNENVYIEKVGYELSNHFIIIKKLYL